MRIVVITCFVIMTLLIGFMGWMNVNTTNAAKLFENDASVQKSKAKFWERKYKDLVESGTCLDRKPTYEEVIG